MSGTNPALRPWLLWPDKWVGPNQALQQASASSQGLEERGGAWGGKLATFLVPGAGAIGGN